MTALRIVGLSSERTPMFCQGRPVAWSPWRRSVEFAGGRHRPVSEARFLRIRRALLARSELIEGIIAPA